MLKKCSKCFENKDALLFYTKRSQCKECMISFQKEYNLENKDKIASYNEKYGKEYREVNKDKIVEKKKKYYEKNKIQVGKNHREYAIKNKEEIAEYKKEYIKSRKKVDIPFALKMNVSRSINRALKKIGSSKNGESCIKYLPFSLENLKQHLESLFEPWMTWENYGKYSVKTWDDKNPATWTWQVDHIIRHAVFKYESMYDIEFKKCWALENLRPLSAKTNIRENHRK